MDHFRLSIIIVSYNTCEMTLECIRSIISETQHINYEIVVFDNSSCDNSVRAISSEFGERVKLISSPENYGFAAGNNKAVQVSNGDYILLLNPDTVILNMAIDHLLEFSYSTPRAGIWGGRTHFPDGKLNPASCWTRQTIWSLFCQATGLTSLFRNSTIFNPEGIGGWDRNGDRQVDIVSGCFLLIRKSLWEILGGFNEEFFMYGEEADLCLRAKEAGASPQVTSRANIIHYGGASETVRTDKIIRLLKAKSLLIRYHFPKAYRRIALFFLYLWPLSRFYANKVCSIFRDNKCGQAYIIWQEVIKRSNEWNNRAS